MEKVGGKTKLLLMQINKFKVLLKFISVVTPFCTILESLGQVEKPNSYFSFNLNYFIVLASQIAVLVERKICCKDYLLAVKNRFLCSTLLIFFQAASINSPTKQTRKNFKLRKNSHSFRKQETMTKEETIKNNRPKMDSDIDIH